MMSEEFKPMRIIALTASNFKRLSAVHITPTGDLVQITGKNAAGKSSVLDAIFAALDNNRVGASMPIRKGANKAIIKLDLGEIVVERRFTAAGATLSVESADGAAFKSPQKLLDSLLGALSFDPLDFTRMKPREQYDLLRTLVKLDVDLDKLVAQNEADFGKRTNVNRDVASMKARVDAIEIPAMVLPAEPIDEADLLDEIQMAGEANAMLERRREERKSKLEKTAVLRAEAARMQEHATGIRREADIAERQAMQRQNEATAIDEALAAAAPIPGATDTTELRTQLDGAKTINAHIARRAQKAQLAQELAVLETLAEELTTNMDGRKRVAAEAVERAEMPVPGLGFGDGIVLLNGVPFDQASSAVALKTSLAIAMKANPTIRVIRIQHGNDLDKANLKVVADMAAEGDMQVWIERVSDDRNVGVVIEDGTVVAVDGVPTK